MAQQRGNKQWDSIWVEVHIKKRLQAYKKIRKKHSDGEAIEELLNKVQEE